MSPGVPTDKERILAQIRLTAAANGGVALGRARFVLETGIKEADWRGTHWNRWSDAVLEAGLQPQAPAAMPDSAFVLAQLAALVRRLGRFPTLAELRSERAGNPAFPSGGAFERLGSKVELMDQLRAFCRSAEGYGDVPGILDFSQRAERSEAVPVADSTADDGYVYLLQSGKHFKLARTDTLERASFEAAQAAEGAKPVHSIRTDDPAGIEAYWQLRFARRKTSGQWYALGTDEVLAFKRRKFM
jgi:hypothetical protein